MPGPATYDASSASEQPVTLPNAPTRRINEALSIQPPLSRRGRGPGLVLFLSNEACSAGGDKPLDPDPVQKWAEEGFAVAFVMVYPTIDVQQTLAEAARALIDMGDTLDINNKFGVIVYDTTCLQEVVESVKHDERFTCVIGFGGGEDKPEPSKPLLLHIAQLQFRALSSAPHVEIHAYPVASPHFVIPISNAYDPGSAALAHTRTLVFLRKHIGGPHFDLEAIWDKHTYFEFEVRSVAKTMGTMVAEPYVNHIPTMTGGVGRENLTRFYRDHFIFSNPADARFQVVSRTVGPDRVVDEFVYHITHDRQVDWLLPGVPATHKKLSIPMIAVVNIRGDRLYNEHIWWDQATALKQAGLLQEYISFPTPEGSGKVLRLPIAGVESAAMLLDESKGRSNEMLGEGWGLVDKKDS